MPIPKFPPERVVTRSNLVMPGEQGLRLAREVFTNFSLSTTELDLLAQLRMAYTPGALMGRLILPKALASFKTSGYLENDSSSASISLLTKKGHVAISMVAVSGETPDLDAWLEEPFMNVAVLGTLQVADNPLTLAVDEFRVTNPS